MDLVRPSVEHLESYRAALARGWSPGSPDPDAGRAELAVLDADPEAFLVSQDDPEGAGPVLTLPDGSRVPRLPSRRRWMWEDELVGVISVRWQPGTEALPRHVPGHIGYSTVPWRRRRGHATAALRALLPEVRALGLRYVELATDETNLASQRVITANGGRLVERFEDPQVPGLTGPALRWRIDLDPPDRAARDAPDAGLHGQEPGHRQRH